MDGCIYASTYTSMHPYMQNYFIFPELFIREIELVTRLVRNQFIGGLLVSSISKRKGPSCSLECGLMKKKKEVYVL